VILPRETIILTKDTVFQKSDYPWLIAVRVTMQAASSYDGNPGHTESSLIRATDFAESVYYHHSRGGRGLEGQQGDDGYVIVELYEEMPER